MIAGMTEVSSALARTLARFIARYFAAGGLPGEPEVIRRAGDGT